MIGVGLACVRASVMCVVCARCWVARGLLPSPSDGHCEHNKSHDDAHTQLRTCRDGHSLAGAGAQRLAAFANDVSHDTLLDHNALLL